MSEENEGKMTTISDLNSLKALRLYSRVLRCLNLLIRIFNLFNVMYIQERITKSKRNYRIRKSETVAQDGYLFWLPAHYPPLKSSASVQMDVVRLYIPACPNRCLCIVPAALSLTILFLEFITNRSACCNIHNHNVERFQK